MKLRIQNLLFVTLFIFILWPLQAQDADELRQKAELYFEGGEYEMAIPVLSELIRKNPEEGIFYQKRGISYLHMQEPAKAIQDLKTALRNYPEDADIYYMLGSAYDQLNIRETAINYFKLTLKHNSSYAPAYYRISVLYMTSEGKKDSALYYANEGVSADPGNPSGYYALAMVHLNNSDYKSSVKAAMEGIEHDPENVRLLKAAGLGFYFNKSYEQSHIYFARALSFSHDRELMYWKAKSRMLFNSDQYEFMQDSLGNLNLVDINAEQADNLDRMLNNRTGNWYYPALRKKFSNSLFEMGIKDFFMLYYGNSNEKHFMNHYPEADSLYLMFNNLQYRIFEQKAKAFLKREPANFPLYYMLSVVYEKTGRYGQQYESLYKYYGFLNAVIASGSGKDPSGAYIITDPEHEQEIISSLGLFYNNSKRILIKDSCYDVVEAADSSGNIQLVYFYVQKACEKISKLKRQRDETAPRGL